MRMEIPEIDCWAGTQNAPIELARSIAAERQLTETPFYIVNLDDVSYKLGLWHEVLPRVEPHYGEFRTLN